MNFKRKFSDLVAGGSQQAVGERRHLEVVRPRQPPARQRRVQARALPNPGTPSGESEIGPYVASTAKIKFAIGFVKWFWPIIEVDLPFKMFKRTSGHFVLLAILEVVHSIKSNFYFYSYG